MVDYKNSKWIKQIAELQRPDGSFGHFHSMSRTTSTKDISTEQALRRLYVLGLRKDDEPIRLALDYMKGVLSGDFIPPDGREKVLNWDAFEKHMFAAWIRIFDANEPLALSVANMWKDIITTTFSSGSFSEEEYLKEHRKRIPILHSGERLIDISQFYMVNILKGLLDEETENAFFEHILNNPKGIYYVYQNKMRDLPPVFASRRTSLYLAALEQLLGYRCSSEKLSFAKEWLLSNRDSDGEWDLGTKANDGVYFPLSDSWRTVEIRKKDCTFKINNLLEKM